MKLPYRFISVLPVAAACVLFSTASDAQTVYSSPVRDVDNPERASPFIYSVDFSIAAGTSGATIPIPTPQSKRAFIDYVSVSCVELNTNDGFKSTLVYYSPGGAFLNGIPLPAMQNTTANNNLFSSTATLLRNVFVDQSSTASNLQSNLNLAITRLNTTYQVPSCQLAVSGHVLY